MSGATLVTGGTGFLGSRIVEFLAERGDEVISVSTTGRWRWGTPPRARFLAMDLADPASAPALRALGAGVSAVVHAAGALYRPSTPQRAYRDAHVEGTRRLLTAISEAGARGAPVRVVHVSTTGVLGPTGKEPKDEIAAPAPRSEYERTKLQGERLALESRRPGVEVAVARPGLVYGPRDLHLVPLFRAIGSGRFRAIAGGGALWQPIHVDDAARAIVAMTATAGIDGEILHLAGAERLTIAEFAARIAGAMGRVPPRGSIPFAPAYAAGFLLEWLCAPFGVDPPLSRSRVLTMTQDRVYAIERARGRLGFGPEADLALGLSQAVAWYRERGLLA